MPTNYVESGTKVGQSFAEQLNKKRLGHGAMVATGQMAQMMAPLSSLNPVLGLPQVALESANKVLKKYYENSAMEMVQQPGGAEALGQLLSMSEAHAAQGPMAAGQPQQPQQTQQPSQQQNPVALRLAGQMPDQSIMAPQSPQPPMPQFQPASGPFGSAQVLPDGNIRESGFFGGVFGKSTRDALEQMQIMGQTPQGQLAQKYNEATQVPPSQRDFLSANIELLKSELANTGKLTEIQKEHRSADTFGQKLIGAIDAYENLKSKGKTGPISGNFAKFKSFIGSGDEDIAEFESMMTGLIYATADHIAQQRGRAATDTDYKNVKRMIESSATSKDATFRGRLRSVINQANAQIPQGGQKLPDVDSLIKQIRQARGKGDASRHNKQVQKIGRFEVEVS